MKTLTLLDLNLIVKSRLRESLPDTYWIQAEVSECKEHYSGHCYLELIQKKKEKDVICARSRATIWGSVWSELGPFFQRQTGSALRAGHQVLIEVAVEFHEIYGMNLVIKNIDPSYTLGDQAVRRLEILRKLESDGIIDQNKGVEWPELPSRIAVISSPAAAGYQDFMHQLTENDYGFVFYTALFPAVMQGETAPKSIIDALDKVMECGVEFDVVVLIRGGGAAADLSCFDDYELCYYCTQFPLPILAGLGHEKDFSVLDRVANTSVKTPTAAAEYLTGIFLQQSFLLETNADNLKKKTEKTIENAKLKLHTLPGRLTSLVQQRIRGEMLLSERHQSFLKRFTGEVMLKEVQKTEMFRLNLTLKSASVLNMNKYKLEILEKSINSFSPERMLERGFSMTVYNGKVLRSVDDIPLGSRLETKLSNGIIESLTERIIRKP